MTIWSLILWIFSWAPAKRKMIRLARGYSMGDKLLAQMLIKRVFAWND